MSKRFETHAPPRRGRRAARAVGCLAILVAAKNGHARNLTDVFKGSLGQINSLADLGLSQIGPALANTVASTYPVASASSSIAYVFDPKSDSYERRTRVLGPIFGERAETIGEGNLSVGLSYSYVNLKTINGDDLDDLVNRASINGRVASFPVPGGVTLADGRFTNFLPVEAHVDIGVEAQIWTPTFTYGVTPDLDLNLYVPLVKTRLGLSVAATVPDPRLPQFALDPGDPNAQTLHGSSSESAFGIGDLLLRAKYVFLREQPIDFAVLLGLSLPTGDPGDLQGTGTTRVQPTFVFSRVLADRFEPILNLGFDLDANDVARSVFRWAAGSTAEIYGPLNGALVFFGRHEFEAQSDPLETPFFLQIERNDQYDASIGLRYLLGDNGVLSANAIVPLNEEGFRADVIPTIEFEYVFSP
jgi:hypothetical protein